MIIIGVQKAFVLDTNILMQSPNSIDGFSDNIVIITGTTLQELDRHKSDEGERGANARRSVKVIENYMIKGDALNGVPTINGGKLILWPGGEDRNYLPVGYSLDVADNRIINSTLAMEHKIGAPTYLVTNDVSMRVNARVCGVKVQEYRNETVISDEHYTGRVDVFCSPEQISAIYANGSIVVKPGDFDEHEFIENEFVTLANYNNPSNTALGIYQKGTINLINEKSLRGWGNIRGKNAAQKMLMYALLAPVDEIPLVIVRGPAGTGKTFLSISCGLDKTYCDHGERNYDTCLITRSNTLSDNDLGFLPGDLNDKMTPLLAPFYDNMRQLFAGKERDLEVAEDQLRYVTDKGIIKIASIAYMRGRSLANTFLIVDEVQNMTVHQALEVVSRIGVGSKCVLLGDPDQIDSRYLDKRSNALVFTAERMKGSPLCAQIEFTQEEAQRSLLSKEAAKRMTM